MKLKKILKSIINIFFKERENLQILTTEKYLEQFEIFKKKDKYIIKNPEKLKLAYDRAWDNRNFEIDKFWTRAAYFWGFIVLIFGAYITVLTSEHNKIAIKLRLDLYLLVLGIVFSVAWYLVIKGSKSWQENWENHIDQLENFLSGPIYKTVHYSGSRFYSVSKINEILSIMVILIWSILFFEYYNINYIFIKDFSKIDFHATFAIIIIVTFVSMLSFGYCLGYYKAKTNGFIDRWE